MRSFLETSTIHGLAYISTSQKHVRFLWTLIVIAAFTGSGYIIYQSFQNWSESPIKTTIETVPLENLTWPLITVCPPNDTGANLNYDLMVTKDKVLDNDTKYELTYYAIQLLQDQVYNDVMKKFRLEDDNRFHDWYYGYTDIKYPRVERAKWNREHIKYTHKTHAASGVLSTPYFGESFDASKLEASIGYFITLILPPVVNPEKLSLHIDIEKYSLKSYEKFYIDGSLIDTDETNVSRTLNLDGIQTSTLNVVYGRQSTREALTKLQLSKMPGFKLMWYYVGQDGNRLASVGSKNISEARMAFIRNG